jgi:hypothetical protein
MKQTWGLFLMLIFTVVLIGGNCRPKSETKEVLPKDTAHYVGIQVCGSCHQDIYQSFSHTGMGSSFSEAVSDKSTADFNNSSFYDAKSNLFYQATWNNQRLILKEFRLSGKDSVHVKSQAIDYIVGSGQHTHSHLFRQGKYIYQAPMTWYGQKKKWDLPPGFEDHNSHFSRMIDAECMSCHNAMPVMEKGSDRRFVSIGQGIDCERCHGPGSEHVRIQQASPGKYPNQHDTYIINPSKLDWQRLTDVCQRCHLQGNNVLKPGMQFTDFKPGMRLSDVFEIYLPQTAGEEPFDMANHAARLQKSKCFIAGKGKLTCISCHNPHVSVKVTGPEIFNQACFKCHSKEACKEKPERLKTLQNNCVKCHMPAQGTEDIPHVTVHDHRIAVHREGQKQRPGIPIGLYAVNNPNPEKRILAIAYLSYYEKFEALPIYREKAFALLKELKLPELWIHYYYQEGAYQKVVSYPLDSKKVSDEMTAYRLGKSFDRLGRLEEAAGWYRKTLELKNDRPEFYADYVAVCIKQGDMEEAGRWIDLGLKEFPDHATLLNGQGYLYFLQGKYADAKKHYVRALAQNPDNLAVLENLALLYATVHDVAKSREYLRRILKIEPGHVKAKKALGA